MDISIDLLNIIPGFNIIKFEIPGSVLYSDVHPEFSKKTYLTSYVFLLKEVLQQISFQKVYIFQ